MKNTGRLVGLERLLLALERDLLEASDEEILSVAAELGINPLMKGTSALFGVTLPVSFREIFEPITDGKIDRRLHRKRKGMPPS